MLRDELKDSRLQVATSLSCSVSAISEGRTLIEPTHCILSHQPVYIFSCCPRSGPVLAPNIGSSEELTRYATDDPRNVRKIKSHLPRFIEPAAQTPAPMILPPQPSSRSTPVHRELPPCVATGDLILVYDDGPIQNQQHPGSSWSQAATQNSGKRSSEIHRNCESATCVARYLSLVLGCDVSGRRLLPRGFVSSCHIFGVGQCFIRPWSLLPSIRALDCTVCSRQLHTDDLLSSSARVTQRPQAASSQTTRIPRCQPPARLCLTRPAPWARSHDPAGSV